ncbi:dTMP kinase [Mitsuaria sp. PDC51]|uniref:dTMP kinase n=1 Tax=unclassified Roseateles TaxID=2626991 RepID=UPI0008EB5E71|nr:MULTISPECIES: dTMP kinase [unclassified Roseateles]MBB3281815.1 dTMP kinase [Mitsuaria sp. BK037]MBB3293862.1 dTMP kinase [Mitsuaria sp. BK041]MBB3363079.1 dTMP kinase [Mitsuaria sp. BK045]SFR99878.1 dTMP kinase [Mitsuaria sp. PDC51]
MSGRFITFEGIDGAGKSTHVESVAQRLRERGADLVQTREPGGTPLAESLRDLFLHQDMDGLTEALLVFAARRDHVQRVIAPALAAGRTVLCDRFTDASFAYQGGGRGMDLQVLGTLAQWVQQGREPDLTFWFDVDPAIAAGRRAQARDADRLEQLDLDFFTRVREGYQRRAEAAPGRIVRIDAGDTIEGVAAQIRAELERRGW